MFVYLLSDITHQTPPDTDLIGCLFSFSSLFLQKMLIVSRHRYPVIFGPFLHDSDDVLDLCVTSVSQNR